MAWCSSTSAQPTLGYPHAMALLLNDRTCMNGYRYPGQWPNEELSTTASWRHHGGIPRTRSSSFPPQFPWPECKQIQCCHSLASAKARAVLDALGHYASHTDDGFAACHRPAVRHPCKISSISLVQGFDRCASHAHMFPLTACGREQPSAASCTAGSKIIFVGLADARGLVLVAHVSRLGRVLMLLARFPLWEEGACAGHLFRLICMWGDRRG